MKYIRGHFVPLRKNIDSLFRADPDTGCWVWLGNVESGYGRIGSRLAYRVMWERKHGPKPAGLFFDHLCRNRACVNPDHLELVTFLENVRRGAKTKLTRDGVCRIHERLRAGETLVAIAKDFGVTPEAISQIKQGRAWKDVHAEFGGRP